MQEIAAVSWMQEIAAVSWMQEIAAVSWMQEIAAVSWMQEIAAEYWMQEIAAEYWVPVIVVTYASPRLPMPIVNAIRVLIDGYNVCSILNPADPGFLDFQYLRHDLSNTLSPSAGIFTTIILGLSYRHLPPIKSFVLVT